mmetsp:Transcript_63007/g.73700  ORF Transcript_63007/g.73700 Transcript_63007/m.73700 type:complete len:268 (-) Transcript_63007:113-916(-)
MPRNRHRIATIEWHRGGKAAVPIGQQQHFLLRHQRSRGAAVRRYGGTAAGGFFGEPGCVAGGGRETVRGSIAGYGCTQSHRRIFEHESHGNAAGGYRELSHPLFRDCHPIPGYFSCQRVNVSRCGRNGYAAHVDVHVAHDAALAVDHPTHRIIPLPPSIPSRCLPPPHQQPHAFHQQTPSLFSKKLSHRRWRGHTPGCARGHLLLRGEHGTNRCRFPIPSSSYFRTALGPHRHPLLGGRRCFVKRHARRVPRGRGCDPSVQHLHRHR